MDATRFFENGDHLRYLRPYRISIPHNATHLWLVEQCERFPVLSGDYHWGWNPNYRKVISPQRHSISNYQRFMNDNGITGISNMIANSQEINFMCIKEHIALLKNDTQGLYNDGIYLKKHVYEKISNQTYEPRLRSYGWENIDASMFDRIHYRNQLLSEFGDNTLKISWGENLAKVLDTTPGSNSDFK